MRENRASHRSDEKTHLAILPPVGDQTHDLPHTVASNMVNVSHALTHSATAEVCYFVCCELQTPTRVEVPLDPYIIVKTKV